MLNIIHAKCRDKDEGDGDCLVFQETSLFVSASFPSFYGYTYMQSVEMRTREMEKREMILAEMLV